MGNMLFCFMERVEESNLALGSWFHSPCTLYCLQMMHMDIKKELLGMSIDK